MAAVQQHSEERLQVAVLFGGRSVEHEISVITALQLIMALDTARYSLIPVYIEPGGSWYTGTALLERKTYRTLESSLARLQQVVLLPQPGIGGLLKVRSTLPGLLAPAISLSEANTIPVDVCVLAFHGEYGEDGCIQGLLEMAGLPYTGCDVLASAAAMNKAICKNILSTAGIPVLPAAVVYKHEALTDLSATRKRILETPGLESYPLFVKPNHLGSSVGISKATDDAALDAALAKVFRYDLEAIVEPCVQDLLEINISVIDGDEPIASVTETPISDSGVLSYEEKYLRGGGKKGGASEGMASLVRAIDPPDLAEHFKEAVTAYALTAFKVLNCSGLGRFDFMLDTATGDLYFNELNPQPGSFSFYLWDQSKPPRLYTENINRMIERALVRKKRKEELVRTIGLKALARE